MSRLERKYRFLFVLVLKIKNKEIKNNHNGQKISRLFFFVQLIKHGPLHHAAVQGSPYEVREKQFVVHSLQPVMLRLENLLKDENFTHERFRNNYQGRFYKGNVSNRNRRRSKVKPNGRIGETKGRMSVKSIEIDVCR